jgi:phosphate-selective porin
VEHRESKRRKVDTSATTTTAAAATNGLATTVTVARPAPAASNKTVFAGWTGQRYEGLSFSAPQRKKLTLEISPSAQEGIRALNGEGEAEFGIPYSHLGMLRLLPLGKTSANRV